MYVRGRGTRRNFARESLAAMERILARFHEHHLTRMRVFATGDDPRTISHSGKYLRLFSIVVLASSCSSPTSREQTHCGECIGKQHVWDISSSFGKAENLIFNVISSRSVELTAAAVIFGAAYVHQAKVKRAEWGRVPYASHLAERPVNNENQLASCSAPFRKLQSCTVSSGKNLEPHSPESRRGQDFLTRTLIDCSNIARIRSHWTKRRNNSAHVRYREKSERNLYSESETGP